MSKTYQTGKEYILYGTLTDPTVSPAQKRRVKAGYRFQGEQHLEPINNLTFNKENGRMEVDYSFDESFAGKTIEVVFYIDAPETGFVTVMEFEAIGYIHTVDIDGYIEEVEATTHTYDILYSKEDYENKDLSNGIKIKDTKILEDLMCTMSSQRAHEYTSRIVYYDGHYTISDIQTELKKLFFFLGDRCRVEWMFQGSRSSEFGTKYLLGTLHNSSQGFGATEQTGFAHKSSIFIHYHSHYGIADHDFEPSGADMSFAISVREYNPKAKFYVYAPLFTKEAYNKANEGKINHKLMTYDPPKLISY